MYSRKCDCGVECDEAEGNQGGEKDRLHVGEKVFS